jgi:hypothetical protein
VAAFAQASSTSGLYGMTLPPRLPGIGSDQQLRLRVVDAQRQVVRGEAAEHDRVHGTDARARQHREHGFGHVRHVDDHAVAATDIELLQHRGEGVHFAIQGPGRSARVVTSVSVDTATSAS